MIDSSKPFPNLETERLYLCQLTMDYTSFLFKLRSNKDLMRYIPRELPKEEDEVLPLLESIQNLYQQEEAINWVLHLKTTNEPIGYVGFFRTDKNNFRTELGYMLLPQFHKQGYTCEAIQVILHHAFTVMQFNSICAVIDPRNEASRKVLLKSNFICEGHFKEDYYFNEVFYDSEVYSILKRNFLSDVRHENEL